MSFRQKRSILLTSVAILFLLSILDVSFGKEDVFRTYSEQFVNEEKMDAFMGAKRAATATAQHQSEINKPEVKEVLLASLGGKISVLRSESRGIRLQYTVTASAASTEAANRKRDAVTVEEQVQNGQLTFVTMANGKPIDPDDVSIEYVLYIPDAMKVNIANENGAVRISGIRADVEASSSNGLMEIAHVQGNISVKSTYGSLYMTDVTGEIKLTNNGSKTTMDHTTGNVVLNTKSGQTHVSEVLGKVTGNTKHGSVYIRQIVGAVDVNNQASDLQFDQIQGDTRVISEAGEISFILPESEGYALDASVSGGSIQTLLPLPIIKQEADSNNDYEKRLKGQVGSGKWKVEAKVRSADILIQIK